MSRRLLALTLYMVAGVALPALAAAQQTASPAPDFSALGRDTVTEFAARHFDKAYARFGGAAASATSPEQLANIWDQLLARQGAFQKITAIRVAEQSGYHIAYVTCAFEKGPLDLVIAFYDSVHIGGMHFAPANSDAAPPPSWTAPAYADPAKFHEVSVAISDGQWTLPGTLTVPDGKGPFSAVVLASGSGANDADETLGPDKPFKDLAWGLATSGIAVLRYPKRTHEYGARSSADLQNFTVKDEYIDDARAAAALLTTRPEINPHAIFLAGHSEGGYLAPRIASGDSHITGIIILEGNTRTLEQLAIDQVQYLAGLGGPGADQLQKMIPELQQQVKIIEDPNLKPGTTVQLLSSSAPASYFLDLRSYDPAAAAAQLKIPILIVQGGRDYQITAKDFASWQKALAGHSNATLKTYPALNHLLISGSGPSTPAEYSNPGHVASEIITDLAVWIHAH